MRKFWIAIPVFIAEGAVGCPGHPGGTSTQLPPTSLPMSPAINLVVLIGIVCLLSLLFLRHHHRAAAHTFHRRTTQ